MDRIRVSSSNIASVGYDANKKVLEVEFLDRSLYQYNNVPEVKYNGLMKAASHGKYFYSNIQKAGFPFEQIR